MSTAVLYRNFDASAPMADANAVLFAAQNAAAAPVAPKSTSRHARRFRRGNDAQHGATSMYSRRVGPSFRMANTRTMRRTNMASAMLMSNDAAGQAMPAPRVSILSAAERRAYVRALREERMRARQALSNRARGQQLAGMLKARFNANDADMADGTADSPRMRAAQARFSAARFSRPGMEY